MVMPMKKKLLILFLCVVSASAVARNYSSGSYRYANVVEVNPVYEDYSVPERQRVCERRRYRDAYYADRHRRGNAGGAVLGGIIGGVLGNQIGSGSGRDAATAVGIIAGAAIGSNNHRRHRDRRSYRGERYCYMQTEYRQEERVVAYEVGYEYDGELFYTTLDHHPGDRIKVVVNHSVAE